MDCSCLDYCRVNFNDVALVTPLRCYCVDDASSVLTGSARLSTSSCMTCRDSPDKDDPFECGNLQGAMSLYFVLEDGPHNPNNHNFNYWQCVSDTLYNQARHLCTYVMKNSEKCT